LHVWVVVGAYVSLVGAWIAGVKFLPQSHTVTYRLLATIYFASFFCSLAVGYGGDTATVLFVSAVGVIVAPVAFFLTLAVLK